MVNFAKEPGSLGSVITGFIERQKGRGVVEYTALQRMGKGGDGRD
jgi:hypothetical protein